MLFGQRFKIIHDMAYKRNNIYLLYTQLHLIFLYFAEIKNLVHQAKHTVGITFYYMQLLTYIIRQSLVFQNIFHRTCNQCQRSAKFVRNICKKAKLYIRNLLFHRHFMFQTINSKQYIYSWKQNQQKIKNINCHSPSRFPKRRLNGDSQTTLILYPNPITIGRFNLKDILSFRKISICSGTLSVYIIPFFIKSA